jgi:hypothetical protein
MQLGRLKELVQGEDARSWLGLSPLFLIFLVVEWLFVHKLESFSQVLSFVGVVAVAVLAGVFPVLLLWASRRKGEHVPAFVLPFLAHPLVSGTIYLVAVSIPFLHGLLIWQNAFQKGVAMLVGLIILAMTYRMERKGIFTRRVVIEVRQDTVMPEQVSGAFSVIDSGRAAMQAQVALDYAKGEQVYHAASGAIPAFSELCSAIFRLAGTKAPELLIWVHRVTPEDQSEALPALVKVTSGKETRVVQLDGTRQQLVLPTRAEGKNASKERSDETGQIEVEVQLATAPSREK